MLGVRQLVRANEKDLAVHGVRPQAAGHPELLGDTGHERPQVEHHAPLGGLERAGVHEDAQNFITTDAWQATNVPGIFAVGDVTGRAPLTPVAIAAGRRLSDRLFNGQKDRKLDYQMIPTVAVY